MMMAEMYMSRKRIESDQWTVDLNATNEAAEVINERILKEADVRQEVDGTFTVTWPKRYTKE